MYPLKFKPYLKFYPYGGRRFIEILEKEGVPRDRDVAETWEVADHGEEQSVVVNGPLAGRTLRSLMEEYGPQLVGAEIHAKYGDYFPLLIKFLDCDKRLPAHLHPSDEDAKRVGLNDSGKTEAWYILRADPGAFAYIGALPGLTAQAFSAAIAKGDAYDGVMNRVQTETGETYFVPAGRPHGLDAGNLAFEVQQNSDAGFGWDWAGFVEAGVIPAADAEQHKTLAPQVALYEDGEVEQTRYVTLQEKDAVRDICCACRYFVLERWRVPHQYWFGDREDRFNTITLLSGAAVLAGGAQGDDERQEVFARHGESLLIPSGVNVEIRPQALTGGGEVEFLRCYVPDLQRDIVGPLARKGHSRSSNRHAWLLRQRQRPAAAPEPAALVGHRVAG
jgi:mannose-6-phosphate isomerase